VPETSRAIVGGGSPATSFRSGSATTITDRQGRQYLDFTAQSWALLLGHAAPEIAEVLSTYAESGWHAHQGFPTAERDELAEVLCDLAGPGFRGVAFSPTSGLAIETAMKLAVRSLPRSSGPICALFGGYHGTTLGTMPMSWPFYVEHSQTSLGMFHELANARINILGRPTEAHADDDAPWPPCRVDQMLEEIDRVKPRAVLVEPIQASRGQVILDDSVLVKLRRATKRSGALLVYDEIQTFARQGAFFTHHRVPEATPDLIVLGKGLASGLPIGAVVCGAAIDPFDGTLQDLHTFANSPLSHAAAIRTIEAIQDQDLLLRAQTSGLRLVSGFDSKRSDGWEARQLGLHVGLRAPTVELAHSMRELCLANGLIIGRAGFDRRVLKFKPPLNVSASEIDRALEIVNESNV